MMEDLVIAESSRRIRIQLVGELLSLYREARGYSAASALPGDGGADDRAGRA